MSDLSVEQELYRKADQEKVKLMKANRRQQTYLWTHVNYPKALWELGRRQFMKFWNGTINE